MSAHISAELRRLVRADAGRRCGYCRSAEQLMGLPLTVDHIIPRAAGGQTVRENLWLACYRCNEHKRDRTAAPDPATGKLVALFNPRTQAWHEHYAWSPDATLVLGLTPCGRATIAALQLNNEFIVAARRLWVEAGWHPPAD